MNMENKGLAWAGAKHRTILGTETEKLEPFNAVAVPQKQVKQANNQGSVRESAGGGWDCWDMEYV